MSGIFWYNQGGIDKPDFSYIVRRIDETDSLYMVR